MIAAQGRTPTDEDEALNAPDPMSEARAGWRLASHTLDGTARGAKKRPVPSEFSQHKADSVNFLIATIPIVHSNRHVQDPFGLKTQTIGRPAF
jgi:hypothetical protein